MKIEDQVCSLPLSKKLAELGLNKGAFLWHLICSDGPVIAMRTEIGSFLYVHKYKPGAIVGSGFKREYYPAFSVAELGVMLPPHFPSFVHDDLLSAHCINYRVDSFPLSDEDGNMADNPTPNHLLNKELVPLQAGKTEADARAYMLIYLIENNYVTIEEVNERLNKSIN